MKICILTPRFPYPENGGDVLRINHIAQYLKQQGNQLILISFCEQEPDIKTAQKLYDKIYCYRRRKYESILNSISFMLRDKPIQCGYYYSTHFQKIINKIIKKEQPQRFIVHLLRMVPYIPEQLIEKTTVEMTDALSKTYTLSQKSKGHSIKKYIYRIEKRLIKKYEKKVAEAFPKTVLVSQADIDYLNSFVDSTKSNLCLHTNGVDNQLITMNASVNNNKICFIGNMRTLQNQDAVLHFYNDIFPEIRRRNNNALFYIIGAEPPAKIKELAKHDSHVVVTGFVESVLETAADSCLAVAPIRIAAGIQNKILMAMAMGIPVVMSSLVAKAIPELKQNENCIIEDDNYNIAAHCITLMGSSEKRNMIARKAALMVKKHYSWDIKLQGY